MLKKSIMIALFSSCIALMVSCDANQCTDCEQVDLELADIAAKRLPIINGTRVTGDDYLSTVALVMHYGSSYNSVFCTGTLITPNYVLTAGHCISYCKGDDENIENYRPVMRVGIGQSEQTLRQIYEIEKFYTHPKFVCTSTDIQHDIAILKLKESVPLSIASPTLPMPKLHDITKAEVDGAGGVTATTVGFGKTDANNDMSAGTKYKTSYKVYAYCPAKKAERSKYCDGWYTANTGFIYFNDSSTGTCQGDSGGPTFFTRDGMEFVGGVTSYGYEDCEFLGAVTMVSDHYDFIASVVDDLAAEEPEDCTNKVDDNGDGRVDCQDPYCFILSECIPEDCQNNKDDNNNGLIDCDDPQCAEVKRCQPEDCTNGVDDNEDGIIDCNDAECKKLKICQPEDCTNGVDDNENGLADCEDPECSGLKICAIEICNDGIDNNENYLIDCQDPQCLSQIICQPEICNDSVDNNANGMIDCYDPQCSMDIHCQIENCQNNIDDNANGLIDCQDPQCGSELRCQPEVCNDQKDNNGDGLMDCGDPQCADSELCVVTPKSSSESCSASPKSSSSLCGFAWLALLGTSLGMRRRRRHNV
ncbi:MAG: trypsin-like serine protease [Proteobacteria bacterium]|nr:trypsin-like serine protease [Pseudomonadota bacterium]